MIVPPKSRPLAKGPKFLRSAVNDIRTDALTARPKPGDGIKIDQTDGDGTLISVDRATVGKPGTGSGTITVQTGPFSGGYAGVVINVDTITLDERYFLIQDNGEGEVLISLITTTCT